MASDSERADRALVASIQQRDSEALAKLYDRHSARLMGLALRILGSTGEAEEILQDVFLYVWRAASSFDGTRGSVVAWLLVATRSRAIDRVRARRPAVRAGLRPLDEVPDPASAEDIEADSAGRQW